jgi:hypothetical protein
MVQAEAANYLRNAKELKDWIDGAIALKYDQKTSDLRKQLGAGSRYFCESLFWASQPKQAAKTSANRA